MHVVICSERFLFRFGADRVLIRLAQGLRAQGHEISLVGSRFDLGTVSAFASRWITPETKGEYINLNEQTAEWLEREWSGQFAASKAPDVAIVAGWPFFASLPFLRRVCRRVIFVDFGAVPLDGYRGGALVTQQKLRRLRLEFIRHSTDIVAISEFIQRSQSQPESEGKARLHTILLAGDHVDQPMWAASRVSGSEGGAGAISILNELRASGRQIILALGRWEVGCYKNSDAAFSLLREVHKKVTGAALVVLARPADLQVPDDLRTSVFPLGFPDDEELVEVMRRCDAGVSLSLWEGFNLPLAEMQWLGKKALALNLGAHPEVIAHPWYLPETVDEMASKVTLVLMGRDLPSSVLEPALADWKKKFNWNRFLADWTLLLSDSCANILMDVTNAARDTANSGVIRVTRRLGRELQALEDPLFVVWDAATRRYVLPTAEEFKMLSQYNGPRLTDEARLSPSFNARVPVEDALTRLNIRPRWLACTETMNEDHFREIRGYASRLALSVAAIFYDAIPVLFPEFCAKDVRDNHGRYMRGLAECSIVIPISGYSAQCLREFWEREKLTGGSIVASLLPGEFGGCLRAAEPADWTSAARILCVSTLEPRKNHKRLIEACLLLRETHPDLEWSLTLVGNRYAGAPEIVDFVQAASAKEPRIRWLGVVDDEELAQQYRRATFTVYPSIVEGFGMPVLESIWHGRPCICSSGGVMAELAAEGGCLTADVQDIASLSKAIATLASDRPIWNRLTSEALARPLRTWRDYVIDFRKALIENMPASPATVQERRPMNGSAPITSRRVTDSPTPAYVSWSDTLYSGCIVERWQMHDSERLGLMSVLTRVRPKCAIEVGTYYGGSLSLLAKYCGSVFSLDIDPEVPNRLPKFENVSFLTGPSGDILPLLLRELDEQGLSPELILIDGDHSREGVKRDLARIIAYKPIRPLWVLMHDSFNPQCRQGMLETRWGDSPYCHWVDLDFVPGRVVEAGPAVGQMWGGLAAAYLHPGKRDSELRVTATANRLFEAAQQAAEALSATVHA